MPGVPSRTRVQPYRRLAAIRRARDDHAGTGRALAGCRRRPGGLDQQLDSESPMERHTQAVAERERQRLAGEQAAARRHPGRARTAARRTGPAAGSQPARAPVTREADRSDRPGARCGGCGFQAGNRRHTRRRRGRTRGLWRARCLGEPGRRTTGVGYPRSVAGGARGTARQSRALLDVVIDADDPAAAVDAHHVEDWPPSR